MEKTIEEWLEQLPDGYRERALANMYEEKRYKIVENMQDAIWEGLGWGRTPEGYDFWRGVYSHYFAGTPLPPLPGQSPKPLKSNEQIFDEVANNVMAEYDPSGFRKKFKTLHKAIIIAMEKAVGQHKNQ
jgi:hypothetical protein